MKISTLVIAILINIALFSEASAACLPSTNSSSRLTLADFPFGGGNGFSLQASFPYSFKELEELYHESYHSQKRLTHHAYQGDSGDFKIPFRNQTLNLPEGVVTHLSHALDEFLVQKKIRHLFFPDAGHAHLLLPETSVHYGKNNLSPAEYQEILSSENFVILLHTREQVDFLDREILHPLEFQERNLLIDFSSKTHKVLDLNEHEFGNMFGINQIEGFQYTSFSFYFQANEKGCLELDKSNIKYDLSLRFH